MRNRRDTPPTLAADRFPKLSALQLAPLSVALAGAGSMVSLPAMAGMQDDHFTATAGQPLTGNVLTNDTGFNGLFVCNFTQPAFGVANVASNGAMSYSPNTGFSGFDGFDYTGCAGSSTVGTAQVFITVQPKGNPDFFTTPYAHPVSGNVLTNDFGNGLSVASHTTPSHGTLQGGVGSNGSFIYVPAIGYTGADHFDYTLRDVNNLNAIATANITITPVDFSFLVNGLPTDTPPPNLHTFVNTQFPPLDVIVAQNSTGVSGLTVCFATVPNSNGAAATPLLGQATTDPNGIAKFTLTANGIVGGYTTGATICTPAEQGGTVARAGRVTPQAVSDSTLVFQLTNDPLPAGEGMGVPTLSGTLLGLLSALVAWLGWRRRA